MSEWSSLLVCCRDACGWSAVRHKTRGLSNACTHVRRELASYMAAGAMYVFDMHAADVGVSNSLPVCIDSLNNSDYRGLESRKE
jgi:predicted ATPase